MRNSDKTENKSWVSSLWNTVCKGTQYSRERCKIEKELRQQATGYLALGRRIE